jgi:hypothetical protein
MLLAQPAYQPALFDPTAWIELGALVIAWAVVAGGLTAAWLLVATRMGWLR